MNPFYNLNSKLRQTNVRIKKQLELLGLAHQIKEYQHKDRSIQYLESGNPEAPMLIFIHGAPGGLDAFLAYHKDKDLAQKARLISVDRPGYGNSNFKQAEPSIIEQAKLLAPLLDLNTHDQAPLVLGHSYGGPIAACLAMEYPSKVESLILVAAALDPSNEKMFWFNTPANWSFVKALIPSALNVANTEKMNHAKALEKLLPNWKKINHFVSLIHGKKDGIVPFENALFARKALVNAEVDFIEEEKMNHLIPWNEAEFLKQVILKHLSRKNVKSSLELQP